MKSFRSYQNERIYDDNGNIAHGDYILEDVQLIIRINKGFLDDEEGEKGIILPAVETFDGSHVEHWKKGVLHCEKQPAVVDNLSNYEEWWFDGKLVEPER